MKSATLAYFALGSCHKKVLCKAFTRNILGTVRDKLKVYIKSLWEFYHNNLVHGPHHPHSNIFHKRAIVLNSHIFILNLSIYTKTKGFWTLNS